MYSTYIIESVNNPGKRYIGHSIECPQCGWYRKKIESFRPR